MNTDQPGRRIRRLSAALALVGFVCGAGIFPAKAYGFEDRIGDLRLGLPEAALAKSVGCKLKREPETLWAADGMYHQTWECADCGLKLGMVSTKRGGTKSLESVTATFPCTLETKRGIRVGSTEKEVAAAYKKDWDKEASRRGENFVAGSIYGGIIFQFQNGKVSQIFLGAAAE